jgi:F420-non-reducing hydrogenase small subunit
MTATKPKVAFYWCAGCGGCDETVVDLDEQIFDVVAAVDLVFWPVALDFKRKDVERLPDGAIAAAFVNGAIRTTEHVEMAHLLRRKAQVVVAFGACAQWGGVPGLANLSSRDAIFRTVYHESPSTVNTEGVEPTADGGDSGLPAFTDALRPLDQVVEVDYYVPGCPPTPALLAGAVTALLGGTLPPRGAVLAPDRALCDTCPRRDSKPEDLALQAFTRPHLMVADPATCLVAQGLLCMGAVTRGGCEARCLAANMPCSGCFGPTSRVLDAGAKALSSMASLLDARDDRAAELAVATIPDPVGSFYRYTLPGSLLKGRRT